MQLYPLSLTCPNKWNAHNQHMKSGRIPVSMMPHPKIMGWAVCYRQRPTVTSITPMQWLKGMMGRDVQGLIYGWNHTVDNVEG